MLLESQLQAAKHLVAMAVSSNGANNDCNIENSFSDLFDFEQLTFYCWRLSPGDSLLDVSFSGFCFQKDKANRYKARRLSRLTRSNIQCEATRFRAEELFKEIKQWKQCSFYKTLDGPGFLTGACRQVAQDSGVNCNLLLVVQRDSRSRTRDLSQLTECLLPAITTVADRYLMRVTNNISSSKPTLTPREYQVLDAILSGMHTPYISDALSISERTVYFHLQNIYRKLGVRSRHEAMAQARADGLSFQKMGLY